jgi:hypothetical protein
VSEKRCSLGMENSQRWSLPAWIRLRAPITRRWWGSDLGLAWPSEKGLELPSLAVAGGANTVPRIAQGKGDVGSDIVFVAFTLRFGTASTEFFCGYTVRGHAQKRRFRNINQMASFYLFASYEAT